MIWFFNVMLVTKRILLCSWLKWWTSCSWARGSVRWGGAVQFWHATSKECLGQPASSCEEALHFKFLLSLIFKEKHGTPPLWNCYRDHSMFCWCTFCHFVSPYRHRHCLFGLADGDLWPTSAESSCLWGGWGVWGFLSGSGWRNLPLSNLFFRAIQCSGSFNIVHHSWSWDAGAQTEIWPRKLFL